MAKASINSGGAVEPVHTRTTGGTEESQVAVIGVDGSDNVVGTPAPADTKTNPTNALDGNSHGLLWNGTTWDRAKGDATNGAYVQLRSVAAGIAIPIVGSVPAQTTASWTSATSVNTAATATGLAAYGQANVQIVVPSTVTAGVVTIEVTADGTNWALAGAVRVDNGLVENDILLAFRPGTNGNRIYAVSLDSFVSMRVRLSTVIAGSGTVSVIIAPAQQGIEPFVAIRPRMAATYGAGYRLAVATAAPYYLSFTYTANTEKQLATVYHAASATKTLRIRYASITFADPGAATVHQIELRRLSATTAPATGNPAITPGAFDPTDAAAEATCLALPTTQGSETAANSAYSPNITWRSGASTQQTDPARAGQQFVLFDGRNGMMDQKPPTVPAGVAGGFAIMGRSLAAVALAFTAYIEFTEEPA